MFCQYVMLPAQVTVNHHAKGELEWHETTKGMFLCSVNMSLRDPD